MRRVQVGPGTNNHNPKMDAGKFAPAASTTGYRSVGAAAGPTSSQASYTATQDIGKQMPAGNDGAGYRLNTTTSVAGPASSQEASQAAKLDPGHNQFLADGGTSQ
mmetsp:Transcript_143094/g.202403  ORF Transcript_143094/g.202403 Transcript_143094/m.202403 type:complete len:105 (-) Transcript_143094:32-346(-)